MQILHEAKHLDIELLGLGSGLLLNGFRLGVLGVGTLWLVGF
jgi:hypothetical protein